MANVVVIDRGWKSIMQEMQKAHRLEVAVGVQVGSVDSEGNSVAAYGAYNEYGTSKIPSRPFMATAFDEGRAAIDADFVTQARLLQDGKIGAHGALLTIGLKHADRIKNTITGRNFTPALAASTVKAKKGSTKTLVDTGALVASIQPVVRGRT
jgi:hypothetical protein